MNTRGRPIEDTFGHGKTRVVGHQAPKRRSQRERGVGDVNQLLLSRDLEPLNYTERPLGHEKTLREERQSGEAGRSYQKRYESAAEADRRAMESQARVRAQELAERQRQEAPVEPVKDQVEEPPSFTQRVRAFADRVAARIGRFIRGGEESRPEEVQEPQEEESVETATPAERLRAFTQQSAVASGETRAVRPSTAERSADVAFAQEQVSSVVDGAIRRALRPYFPEVRDAAQQEQFEQRIQDLYTFGSKMLETGKMKDMTPEEIETYVREKVVAKYADALRLRVPSAKLRPKPVEDERSAAVSDIPAVEIEAPSGQWSAQERPFGLAGQFVKLSDEKPPQTQTEVSSSEPVAEIVDLAARRRQELENLETMKGPRRGAFVQKVPHSPDRPRDRAEHAAMREFRQKDLGADSYRIYREMALEAYPSEYESAIAEFLDTKTDTLIDQAMKDARRHHRKPEDTFRATVKRELPSALVHAIKADIASGRLESDTEVEAAADRAVEAAGGDLKAACHSLKQQHRSVARLTSKYKETKALAQFIEKQMSVIENCQAEGSVGIAA